MKCMDHTVCAGDRHALLLKQCTWHVTCTCEASSNRDGVQQRSQPQIMEPAKDHGSCNRLWALCRSVRLLLQQAAGKPLDMAGVAVDVVKKNSAAAAAAAAASTGAAGLP